MGGASDYIIDVNTAVELAGRNPGDLRDYEITELTYSSPDILERVLVEAQHCDNEAMIGMVGAMALMGAKMSYLERSNELMRKGITTSHNLHTPEEYQRVARRAFPNLLT